MHLLTSYENKKPVAKNVKFFLLR